MNNILIIDSKNKRVTINSDHELTVPEILTEFYAGEFAIKTATQNFMIKTGAHIIPKEY
jgi:hypothetical protein